MQQVMGRIAVIGAGPVKDTATVAILLARELAARAKVVLLDLALEEPGLAAIGADPAAPGISNLVMGTASFGEIIARDPQSRIHFIGAGSAAADPAAIFVSPWLVVAIEALGRSYDHVVINAGALGAIAVERVAELAPQAVVVADTLDDPAASEARARLLIAGCKAVSVLPSAPLALASLAARAAA